LMTTDMHSVRKEVLRAFVIVTVLLPALCLLGACNDLQKSANAGDGSEIVHQGNRVIVPEKNPLAARLQAEAVVLSTVQRQVAAPASVEADPARYARILPPLSGRVLRLLVRPGDSVTLWVPRPTILAREASSPRRIIHWCGSRTSLLTALLDKRILTRPPRIVTLL